VQIEWAHQIRKYVQGDELVVPPGKYFAMGDNRDHSSDSRYWGLVPERLLLGRAQVVYYPFYFPWPPLWSQVNRVGLIR